MLSATEAFRIEKEGRPRAAVVPVGLGVPRAFRTTHEVPPEVAGVDFVPPVDRLNERTILVTILVTIREGLVHPCRADPRDLASNDGLAWLYSHTSLFLVLSLDEGFGIPCLEALYFGAPVLASDIPMFRKVLGGRATFVDPLSVDAIVLCPDRTVSAARPHPVRPRPVRPEELGYSWDERVRRLRSAIVSV